MRERRKNKTTGTLDWRISTLVFLLAGTLISLATASLVFIGYVASKEADAQAAENQLRLFENVLRNRHFLVARDQLSVARWDRSVANISIRFNRKFVRDEFVDSLWYDYGHDRTLLIGPGAEVLADASKGSVAFARRTLGLDDQLRRVAEKAVERHNRNRIEIKGGFGQKSVPGNRIDEVAEFAFVSIEGRPAMVSAMAIVPDDGEVALPERPPVILLSAKFIDETFAAELNGQSAFHGLQFKPGVATDREAASEGAQWNLHAEDGSALGAFSWKNENPGAEIWSLIVPIILLLGGVLAIAALAVARQIGRLSIRLETSEKQNRHLARHDALTGLANRLQFDTALETAVDGLPVNAFAVIACDLDRFKAVNDTYGHAGGDTVIRTIARRLTDAVGTAGLVARIGGDEFAILLTGFTDQPRLSVLSRQIIASVCDPIQIDGCQSTDVGVSLGVAVAPDAALTGVAIVAAADAALYEAKERGRGVAVFFQNLSSGASVEATASAKTSAASASCNAA